jgi:hypothetical protein
MGVLIPYANPRLRTQHDDCHMDLYALMYGSACSNRSRRGTDSLNTIRVTADIVEQARRYYGESAGGRDMECPRYGSKYIQKQTGHEYGRVGERALCDAAAAEDDGAGR